MDILEMHERAVDQAGQIVAGVQPDQMNLPTPCTEWSVEMLLAHMIGGNWNSAATAGGEGRQSEESVSTDPATAYQESAAAVKVAWREPGRLERVYEMPMGMLPGQAVLGIRLLETITHGWDLARATGQPATFDDDLVQAAMQVAQVGLSGERPPHLPFAPAVEVSGDLPAIDHLAAFMGRQPF